MGEFASYEPPLAEEVTEATEKDELRERHRQELVAEFPELTEATPHAELTTELLLDILTEQKVKDTEALRRYVPKGFTFAADNRSYQGTQNEYAAGFDNGAVVLFPRFFAGPVGGTDDLRAWQGHVFAHEIAEGIQAPRNYRTPEGEVKRVEFIEMAAYRALQSERDPAWNQPYIAHVYDVAQQTGNAEALANYYREAGADDLARYLRASTPEAWVRLLIEGMDLDARGRLTAALNDPSARQNPESEINRLLVYAEQICAFYDEQFAKYPDGRVLADNATENADEALLDDTDEYAFDGYSGGFTHGSLTSGMLYTKGIDDIIDFLWGVKS